MHENNSVAQPAPDRMPDLAPELQYWRRAYPDRPFFKSGLQFERYVATFKFGYDTFLLNHANDSVELFSSLCHQYKDGVAACDRIDWAEAALIVSATWERLRGPDSASISADTSAGSNSRDMAARFPAPQRWERLLARRLRLHAVATGPRQASLV